MNICRHCSGKFEAKDWQISKSDFECDPCRRARQANYRLARKLAGIPVVSGRMSREYHQAYEADYFKDPANRERRNELMRSYAKAHGTKEHHAARWKVHRALKAGSLMRCPCEVCGADKTHAHHDDYSKPLDVRWLCPMHHREHHAKATGGQL